MNHSKFFLGRGITNILYKNRLLVISWINDCSRGSKFFCQARKPYSYFFNRLISCMCLVNKVNNSHFLLGRGILDIFGQLCHLALFSGRFAKLENNVPIFGIDLNFETVLYTHWSIFLGREGQYFLEKWQWFSGLNECLWRA